MLTPSDRHWHRVYEALRPDLKEAMDAAYDAATSAILTTADLRHAGIMMPGDDRAEVLIGAFTRYLCESNPDHAGIKEALASVAAEDAPAPKGVTDARVLELTRFATAGRPGANASSNVPHWDAKDRGLWPVTARWLYEHPDTPGWFWHEDQFDTRGTTFIEINGVDMSTDETTILLDYGSTGVKVAAPTDEVFVRAEDANR